MNFVFSHIVSNYFSQKGIGQEEEKEVGEQEVCENEAYILSLICKCIQLTQKLLGYPLLWVNRLDSLSQKYVTYSPILLTRTDSSFFQRWFYNLENSENKFFISFIIIY